MSLLPRSTNSRCAGAPAAGSLTPAERSLIDLDRRLLEPSASEERPSEAYATLIFLPLIARALAFSRRRRNVTETVAATGNRTSHWSACHRRPAT